MFIGKINILKSYITKIIAFFYLHFELLCFALKGLIGYLITSLFSHTTGLYLPIPLNTSSPILCFGTIIGLIDLTVFLGFLFLYFITAGGGNPVTALGALGGGKTIGTTACFNTANINRFNIIRYTLFW